MRSNEYKVDEETILNQFPNESHIFLKKIGFDYL